MSRDVRNKVEDELRRVITKRLNVKRELFLIVHKFADLETWRRIYIRNPWWFRGSVKEKSRHVDSMLRKGTWIRSPPFIPLEVRADLSLESKNGAPISNVGPGWNPYGVLRWSVEWYVGMCVAIVEGYSKDRWSAARYSYHLWKLVVRFLHPMPKFRQQCIPCRQNWTSLRLMCRKGCGLWKLVVHFLHPMSKFRQ